MRHVPIGRIFHWGHPTETRRTQCRLLNKVAIVGDAAVFGSFWHVATGNSRTLADHSDGRRGRSWYGARPNYTEADARAQPPTARRLRRRRQLASVARRNASGQLGNGGTVSPKMTPRAMSKSKKIKKNTEATIRLR